MKIRKNQLTWTLLCLALVGVSHAGYGKTIGFQPPVIYPVGTAPRAVASGDFNGDGKMDLAIANFGNPNANDDGGVSILLGNGDGTFQAQQNVIVGKTPCPLPYLPCLIAADYNGDGRLDLAVLKANDTLSVLLGNGDGTFQAHADYATGNGAIALRVGDVNGDQRPDLIVLQAGSVGILLGNGDGTFQNHADHSTGSNPGALAVLDVNDDGKLDLVMTLGFLGIETLFGNGDGTFQPGIYCSCGAQGNSAPGVAAVGPIEGGDFNGDGRMDLAVLFYDTTDINHPFREEMVLLGNGDGTFQPIDTGFRAISVVPTSAAIADFNGDGHSDLAIGFSAAVYVLSGNGDGTFQPSVSFDTGSNSDLTSVAAADLNGDKSPDVIVTHGDNTISVLLNTAGTDFSISASAPSPPTVSRGQSATSTVTLHLLNAFDNAVALTCSVQPAQAAPTCSLNPSSVTFDANGNATATLTINAGTAAASFAAPSPSPDSRPLGLLWLPLAGFALTGAGFRSSRSTRRKLTVCLLFGVLFSGLIFQAACGGASSGGPHSTTYTITITGTSGSTQHSTTVTLAVQ
ncbi:MAG: FG-GAP-like repeat-containing protein [Terriglobales bacterium]